MMRVWILLAALALVVGSIACTPDMINHNDGAKGETTVDAVKDGGGSDTSTVDTGNTDTGKPDTGTVDTGKPDTGSPDTGNPDTGKPDTGTACKHDCDCHADGKVCHDGTCQSLRRPTGCVACTTPCKKGEPCIAKDGKIVTCAGGACKDDCDCVLSKQAGVCVKGVCDPSVNTPPKCPDCSSASCPAGSACKRNDGAKDVCPGPVKCKDDCDCHRIGKVCDSNGECAALRRQSLCVSCSSAACKAGNRCYEKDDSIGVCKGAKSCKSDCDCKPSEGVCHQGKCDPTLKRAYVCPSCSGNCVAGKPCRKADGSTGVCNSGGCKHDCDCVNQGMVCDSNGKCAPLRRKSNCEACTGSCKPGDPCLNKDKTIGTCGAVACKDDCDCLKPGGVCENNKCNKIVARASSCLACSNTKCKAGTRCYNADRTIGVCNKSCKHDCDCVPVGLLCSGTGQCAPLRRLSNCHGCNSGKCKPGGPCQKSSTTVGVCPTTGSYQCGTRKCRSGLEYCTTTTGGAPPSCQSLPPQPGTTCPTGCSNAGLRCMDGKLRCYCPSSSCTAYKQNCKDCKCLQSTGQVPKNACQCTDKQGDAHVSCFAP